MGFMARAYASGAKAADPAGEEQRQASRMTMLLRAGKLITDDGQFLCVVRDISSGGVKLRLFHPLTLPEHCEIELCEREPQRVALAWHDGDTAGFRFSAGQVERDRLLEEHGEFGKRSIRLRLRSPREIVITAGERSLRGELRDISQHGAALDCASWLARGLLIELHAPQLGSVAARVRWRRGDTVGVVFQRSFRLDELAGLAAAMQSPLGPDTTERAAAPTRKRVLLTTD